MVMSVTDPLVIAPEDPVVGFITNNLGIVECDASGSAGGEQSVGTTVGLRKGEATLTLTGIVCKLYGDSNLVIGTSYASGSSNPLCFFKFIPSL